MRHKMNGEVPLLLTADQVAGLLGVSRATLYRRVADNTLPQPVRIGDAARWRRADIEAAIAALPEGFAKGAHND